MNIKKNIRIYRNWLMKGHGMKIWQKFHLDSWLENFAGVMDEGGNMGGKVSGETKVGRIRCENRPDSNTEPLRSLVQFVISRDIPRHSPEITAIFSFPPCQCFHFPGSRVLETRSITRPIDGESCS